VVSDLRRLGKRGSYRLGRLAAPPAPPARLPTPHYPSFTPGRRGPAALWLAGWLLLAAIVAAAALIGWWFLPFLAGLAVGLASRYARAGFRLGLLAGVTVAAAGWGAALWWSVLRGLPEGATARVIASLAGLPPYAAAAVAVTLCVAIIQAVAGLWLARALVSGGPRELPPRKTNAR
jgi:hypothetical protein